MYKTFGSYTVFRIDIFEAFIQINMGKTNIKIMCKII